ncbi:hypothetical protein TWF481_002382 [Arthrobotrys musiformis]|uniref:Uncharacterized protein n=1 Tax=Arthrobotrys musiformis TaxID=47236 RepID=A0AAV9VVV0_9PEZI
MKILSTTITLMALTTAAQCAPTRYCAGELCIRSPITTRSNGGGGGIDPIRIDGGNNGNNINTSAWKTKGIIDIGQIKDTVASIAGLFLSSGP